MKWLVLPLFIVILSCGELSKSESESNEKVSQKKKDSTITEAKTIEVAKRKISIQVLYTSSYCGGAPPNEEILAETNKKRWYQNSGIRIFSNTDHSLIYHIQTNNEGVATIELPYGSYSVLLDTTCDEQMSHLYNVKCKAITDKKWKKFSISEKGLNGPDSELLWVVIEFPCDPCDPTIKMRP